MSEPTFTLTSRRPRFSSLESQDYPYYKKPKTPHNTTQYIMNSHKEQRKLSKDEIEILDGSMMQAIKEMKKEPGGIWFKSL